MACRLHLSLPAERANLPRMLALVDTARDCIGIDADAAYDIRLAVDEMCTNLIDHGYRDLPAGPMALLLDEQPDRLVIRLSDRGHACPPEAVPAPDLAASWDERRIGGLGWHLTRQVMDSIDYATAADGEHHLTLVKHLRRTPYTSKQGQSMKFDVSHAGTVCIVKVIGSIDGTTSQDLQDTLAKLLGPDRKNMVIDCSELQYTSSAGLRVLLGGVKDSRRMGGDLRLASVQGGVLKVLTMAGFDSILKIYPDAQHATESFQA